MIPAPTYDVLWRKRGHTKDIMAGVIESVEDGLWTSQTSEYSKKIDGDLRLLWIEVRAKVRYIEDPDGVQDIKSPALTWHSGYGDCKSMTVLISSVLQNMGVPHLIRFSSYRYGGKFTHVYPVAIIDGNEIPIDAVHHIFGKEVQAKRQKDYQVEVNSIAGIPSQNEFQFILVL